MVAFAVTMEGNFLRYYFTNANLPSTITIKANEWQPSPTRHLVDFEIKQNLHIIAIASSIIISIVVISAYIANDGSIKETQLLI
jgi:hypothetical protein